MYLANRSGLLLRHWTAKAGAGFALHASILSAQ